MPPKTIKGKNVAANHSRRRPAGVTLNVMKHGFIGDISDAAVRRLMDRAGVPSSQEDAKKEVKALLAAIQKRLLYGSLVLCEHARRKTLRSEYLQQYLSVLNMRFFH